MRTRLALAAVLWSAGALAGARRRGAGAPLSNYLFRFFANFRLHRLPLGVHPIELGAELPCGIVIGRGEEIDGGVRRCQSSRGVDARSEFESDIACSQCSSVNAGAAQQRAQ